jgi:tRNA pseudouridine38-40 synthase
MANPREDPGYRSRRADSCCGGRQTQLPCYLMDGHDNPRQQTWRLTLAYDGADFYGWQIQPDRRTIQGELQAAIGRITGEFPLPQGSGRTDAGVHALGQVASFPLCAPIPPENLLRALNRTLPHSIRILEARQARTVDFHARHSAVAKTYEYRIFPGSDCSPFLARYVHSCPWALDFVALQATAQAFLGKHDFQSFASTDPDLAHRPLVLDSECGKETISLARQSTLRTIFSSAWETRTADSTGLLVYTVRGDGFLHHMVRNLVGTMIDIGRGLIPLPQIPRILAARSRSAAGPTAPACGLFLVSVEYPPEAG